MKRGNLSIINSITCKDISRNLIFRTATRILLGKRRRNKLFKVCMHKKLRNRFGFSAEQLSKLKWKISYVGWVGHGNLGDEALYQVNTKIFKPYHLIPDIGIPFHSKITLFGGGTLFPEGVSEGRLSECNYAYGVGVKDPSFWGKFDLSIVELIENFKYIGVRGNISQKLLKDWGINSEVIGDPCLLLEPSRYQDIEEKREERKIAICVGSDGFVWGGNEKNVFKEIGRTCKILKKKGYYPILIPFWENNMNDIRKISRRVNVPIFRDWRNVQQVLDLISSCHILIGEKLHSIVFSAATYTPFISIEYRPKCRDFAETMGLGQCIVRTDEVTAEKIMMIFSRILGNWIGIYKKLAKNVKFYRNKLRKAAKWIKRDIKNAIEYP